MTQYDAIAPFTCSWDVTLTGAGEARTVPVAFVSDGLLELFGARSRSGRLLTPSDEQTASNVAVVSEQFWDQTSGHGTPLDGQIIRLDAHLALSRTIRPQAIRSPESPAGSVM